MNELLKISPALSVSLPPPLWINNSFILSIIEMQGARGDLVAFNLLVCYEYKYKAQGHQISIYKKKTQTNASGV